MQTHSITVNVSALSHDNRAAILALRDSLMAARDLAADFDAAGAVAATRAAYWLLAARAVLFARFPRRAAALDRASDKAQFHRLGGAQVRFDAAGYGFVLSATTAGTVYRVSPDLVCNCPAGEHRRACWHALAVAQARAQVETEAAA
jgi:hypothetical protein